MLSSTCSTVCHELGQQRLRAAEVEHIRRSKTVQMLQLYFDAQQEETDDDVLSFEAAEGELQEEGSVTAEPSSAKEGDALAVVAPLRRRTGRWYKENRL